MNTKQQYILAQCRRQKLAVGHALQIKLDFQESGKLTVEQILASQHAMEFDLWLDTFQEAVESHYAEGRPDARHTSTRRQAGTR